VTEELYSYFFYELSLCRVLELSHFCLFRLVDGALYESLLMSLRISFYLFVS
jgi:hypothetical protein